MLCILPLHMACAVNRLTPFVLSQIFYEVVISSKFIPALKSRLTNNDER